MVLSRLRRRDYVIIGRISAHCSTTTDAANMPRQVRHPGPSHCQSEAVTRYDVIMSLFGHVILTRSLATA